MEEGESLPTLATVLRLTDDFLLRPKMPRLAVLPRLPSADDELEAAAWIVAVYVGDDRWSAAAADISEVTVLLMVRMG